MNPTLSVASGPAAKAPYSRDAAARPATPADRISPRRDIDAPLGLAMLELVFMRFLPRGAGTGALLFLTPPDRVSPAPDVTSIHFFAACLGCRLPPPPARRLIFA